MTEHTEIKGLETSLFRAPDKLGKILSEVFRLRTIYLFFSVKWARNKTQKKIQKKLRRIYLGNAER